MDVRAERFDETSPVTALRVADASREPDSDGGEGFGAARAMLLDPGSEYRGVNNANMPRRVACPGSFTYAYNLAG